MKITKRQLRRIIREAIDLGIIPGDEVLILPPGSSHGTVHVQVVEVLPKTVLVKDEAGYEFEIPYRDVLEKSTGKFNPVKK